MLVYRKIRQSNVDDESRQGAAKYEMKYDVYRVDFDAGDLIPVKGLGGRAVFLGLCRSVTLLPAEAFPSIAADTLYLGFDCREKTEMNEIDGYNVADGSSEQAHATSTPSSVRCRSRTVTVLQMEAASHATSTASFFRCCSSHTASSTASPTASRE